MKLVTETRRLSHGWNTDETRMETNFRMMWAARKSLLRTNVTEPGEPRLVALLLVRVLSVFHPWLMNRSCLFALVLLWIATAVCDAAPVIPPVMTPRSIAPGKSAPPGTSVVLSDRGTNFTLFLPVGWTNTLSSTGLVVVHFHTAPWFAIQEHLRRAAREPLLVFALGEGSTTYRLPFEDTNRFTRVLELVTKELRVRGQRPDAGIVAVDVSSFSAGYGAVRELVKVPVHFQRLRRIVLLDSFYGGLEPAVAGNTNRVPLAEHIDAWVPFAGAAMRGEKVFVLTHTQIATRSYASTFECAAALLGRLGVEASVAKRDEFPAARELRYPLLTHADREGLHVWSYSGDDAESHMTHARRLAEVWMALDAAGVR